MYKKGAARYTTAQTVIDEGLNKMLFYLPKRAINVFMNAAASCDISDHNIQL